MYHTLYILTEVTNIVQFFFPTSIMNATIVVTPVNNHIPEILQMEYVSPPEGGWIAVTPEMLKVVDADLPGDVLTITVCSNDPNGYFAVSTPEVTRSRTTIFSMDDVNRGRIVFVHELGTSLSHSLSVKVEDGIHTVNGVSVCVCLSVLLC